MAASPQTLFQPPLSAVHPQTSPLSKLLVSSLPVASPQMPALPDSLSPPTAEGSMEHPGSLGGHHHSQGLLYSPDGTPYEHPVTNRKGSVSLGTEAYDSYSRLGSTAPTPMLSTPPVKEGKRDKGSSASGKLGTTPLGKPRLFVCRECTRAFARQEHLSRHERSHTQEKPFNCGICNRKFARRDLLLRHAQKLHAGCSDTAIRRLRRRRGSSKTSIDTPLGETPAGSPAPRDNYAAFYGAGGEFLGLESGLRVSTPLLSANGSTTALLENPSYFECDPKASTQRPHPLSAMFKRRASFSASSGPNYAIPPGDTDTGRETVEFSTPQMEAMNDAGWLAGLGDIPELEQYLTAALTLESPWLALYTGGSGQYGDDLVDPSLKTGLPTLSYHMNLDGAGSVEGNHNLEAGAKGIDPLEQLDANPSRLGSVSGPVGTGLGTSGYSFYAPPEPPALYSSDMPKPFPTYRVLSPLLPPSPAKATTPVVDPFDIDEILNDLNDTKTQFSAGYSFYNMDFQSASSNSTNATISPKNQESASLLAGRPGGSLETAMPLHLLDHGINPNYAYSRTVLFTYNLRTIVYQSLAKYPFVGYPTPHIPSNEKLEKYRHLFTDRFLIHYPFIHPAMLTEYEMMQFSQPGSHAVGAEASFICLPLLVTAIGAILSNQKTDAGNLYEASRRCIHVFLELRKNKDVKALKERNPLWLVQALTLSVMYSLFADCDVNLAAVLRQVNALGGLLTASPQTIEEYPSREASGDVKEEPFLRAVKRQLKSRTVMLIYSCIMSLAEWYNVPPRITAHDLRVIELPSAHDEAVWGCLTASQFHQLPVEPLGRGINFMDTLYLLLNNDLSQPVFKQLGGFTLVCLIHGIYDQFALVSASASETFEEALSHLRRLVAASRAALHSSLAPGAVATTRDGNPSTLSVAGLGPSGWGIHFDALLLLNYLQVKALINLNHIKEKVFLNDYTGLGDFFIDMPHPTDAQYLKIVTSCNEILRVSFFEPGAIPGDDEWTINETQLASKISLNYQLLFDVFLILVKFTTYMAEQEALAREAGEPAAFTGPLPFPGAEEFGHSGQPFYPTANPLQLALARQQATTRKIFHKFERLVMIVYQMSDFEAELQRDVHAFEHRGDPTTLRMMKIGGYMFKYLYDFKLKVVIFQKLADALFSIRASLAA